MSLSGIIAAPVFLFTNKIRARIWNHTRITPYPGIARNKNLGGG